jgi:hypothetical protein
VGIELQVGSRLRSAVCETEVVVVKAPTGELDLRCGGAPMAPSGEEGAGGTIAEGLDGGTLLGKRYTDGDQLELLCSKAGAGTLSVGDEALEIKGAKPLPSSD